MADIVGKKFIDFEFEYVDKDGKGKLSDVVGDKPVVVDFYTTVRRSAKRIPRHAVSAQGAPHLRRPVRHARVHPRTEIK